MKWEELPQGATVSMSKGDVEELRGSGVKTFVTGAICGALLVIGLQSCSSEAPKGGVKPTPKPSQSATVKPTVR